MSQFLKLAYFNGVHAAHTKLGTAAGPIPYAEVEHPATGESPQDTTHDRYSQREFKSLDEHNNLLELTKNADYIRGDLDKIKPQKAEIQRSNIERAFSTNDAIGEEYGLGDPGYTQPHGSDKVAAEDPFGGAKGINSTVSTKGLPPLPKIPGASSINKSTTAPLANIAADSNATASMGSRNAKATAQPASVLPNTLPSVATQRPVTPMAAMAHTPTASRPMGI
mgnify:CR=1 FL=1